MIYPQILRHRRHGRSFLALLGVLVAYYALTGLGVVIYPILLTGTGLMLSHEVIFRTEDKRYK